MGASVVIPGRPRPNESSLDQASLARAVNAGRGGAALALAFGTLAVGLIAIGMVALVAIDGRQDAETQRSIAESRALALQSADALDADPELALRLALLGVDRSETEQAAAALREATLAFRQLAVVKADSLDANAAALSPDGKRMVTGGTDGRAAVWDAATGRVLSQLPPEHGALLAARYAPDGEQIALGFEDGTVALTDGSLATQRVALTVDGQRVESVAFSGDGRRIAAALSDGTVRVFATDGSEPPRRLSAHDGPVLAVDMSADGKRIVSAGKDGSVQLWSVASGASHTLRRGRTPETDVAFSPDGGRILAVGEDGWIRLWSTGDETETRVRGEGRQLKAAAFSADGRRFAVGGRDGVLRVWNVAGGPPVAVLRGQSARIYDVGFGPSSDRVLSAGDDGTVRIWDAGRTQAWTVPGLTWSIDFNRNGRLVASSSNDGTVRIWDAGRGQLRASVPGANGFTAGRFSPSADTVLITSDAGSRVLSWPADAATADSVVQLPKGRGMNAARFDAVGDRIVYADAKGRVAVRDAASGREVELGGGPEVIYDVKFSPDGERVAAATEQGDIPIWRIARPARPERILNGHRGHVNTVDFRPDGRLVSGGADRTVRVWGPRGNPEFVMEGHEDEVTSVVVTADGTKVLSSSQDGSLRLWDSSAGIPLAVLQSGAGPIYEMALSNKRTIATLGEGEVVRVFRCEVCGSVEQVRALALSREPRQLDRKERQRFLASGS